MLDATHFWSAIMSPSLVSPKALWMELKAFVEKETDHEDGEADIALVAFIYKKNAEPVS